MTNSEGRTQVEQVSRRNIAGLLLGAVGAGLASSSIGCTSEVSEAAAVGETGEGLIQDIDSYAVLRAYSWTGTTPGTRVWAVRGREVASDGGEGIFIWDGSFQPGSYYDNDGTYLKPNHYSPSQAGRWRRVRDDAINVLWFGADPSGQVSSLLAFQRAATAAGAGGTVFVPRGVYLLPPDSGFLWWARRWVGERLHPVSQYGTVIRPLSGGTTLVTTGNSATSIENIAFDGKRIDVDTTHEVDVCLHLKNAHNSTLRNVSVENAKVAGLKAESVAFLLAEHVLASRCAVGIQLHNCTGTNLVSPIATFCSGPGLELVGGAGNTASPYAGTLTVLNASIDSCGTDGVSPLCRVYGLEGGVVQFSYLHVNTGESPTALLVDGNTHNVRFVGAYFEHATAAVLADIANTRACSFEQFAAPGPSTTTNRILIDANTCRELSFSSCYRASRTSEEPTNLEWDDGSTTWVASARDGQLQATAPPPSGFGVWQAGQQVHNSAPATGQPLGWIYSGSSWLSMPTL